MVLPPAPIINPAGGGQSSSSGDRVPKQNKGVNRWRSGKAPGLAACLFCMAVAVGLRLARASPRQE
jgi:hypothetical protein